MAKLFFYYSTMNAGKSTSLLQAAHNYAERGMQTMLFTARLDNRSRGRIASRIGIDKDAQRFDVETDFWRLCPPKNPHCVLVDEAQFLTKDQVRQLARVVDEANIPVMCYGLRTDFRGELFPGSAALLAWGGTPRGLESIRGWRGKGDIGRGVMAEGRGEGGRGEIRIGGNERYVSLCRKHFSEAHRTGVCPDANPADATA